MRTFVASYTPIPVEMGSPSVLPCLEHYGADCGENADALRQHAGSRKVGDDAFVTDFRSLAFKCVSQSQLLDRRPSGHYS